VQEKNKEINSFLFHSQDKFLVNVDSDEIGIDVSDVNLGTLSKAFKFATRTRLKVKIECCQKCEENS
jgi:hypothetical protein